MSISNFRLHSDKFVSPPLLPPAVHLILSPDSGEQHGVRHHITSVPYIASVYPTGQKFRCVARYIHLSQNISGAPISWFQGCEVCDILEDQVAKVFKYGRAEDQVPNQVPIVSRCSSTRVQGVQVACPSPPCLPLIALDCQPVSDELAVTN